MRYFIFLFIILGVLNVKTYSQERRFAIRTGAGYYADVMGMYDGPVIWLESGIKLNTGFYFNGRVSVASIDWNMSEGPFKDYKTIALRQMVDLTFSKPFKLTGKHFLEPGVGFKLKREYSLKPDFTYIYSSGSYQLYTSYSDIFYEIGFTICLDYYYQFSNNFYLGLRADTNVIWAIGFEGLTISPLFGFSF